MQAKFVTLFSAVVALSATVAQAAAVEAHGTQFMDLAKRRDSGYAGPPGAPIIDDNGNVVGHTRSVDLAKRRDSGYAGPPDAPTTGGSSHSDGSYGPPPSRNPAEFEYKGDKWVYHGCWTDQSGPGQTRALTGYHASSERRTVEFCLQACSDQNQGYTFAGLEYGKECFCGSRIESFSQPTATCDMVCSAANGQVCGGRDALTMYQIQK